MWPGCHKDCRRSRLLCADAVLSGICRSCLRSRGFFSTPRLSGVSRLQWDGRRSALHASHIGPRQSPDVFATESFILSVVVFEPMPTAICNTGDNNRRSRKRQSNGVHLVPS